MPKSGSLTNLSVRTTADAGTGGDNYAITVRIGGEATALACTITSASNTCTSAGPVAVAAGQLLAVEANPGGSPVTISMIWKVTFTGS